MHICHHEILPSEIVGIGPMQVQASSDPAMRTLYNMKKLWFFLHLRTQSIKIETDMLSFSDIDRVELAAHTLIFQDFTDQYNLVKAFVQRLSGGAGLEDALAEYNRHSDLHEQAKQMFMNQLEKEEE